MLNVLVKKLVGSKNERDVKRMRKQVTAINALEESIAALDDAALAAKTAEFRSRLEAGEKHDALLPEAFAVVREASKRVDRKSTRLNSSHMSESRMPSSA